MRNLIKKILKESEEDFDWIPAINSHEFIHNSIIYFDKGLTLKQWSKLKDIFKKEGITYLHGPLSMLDHQVFSTRHGGFRVDKEKTILWIDFDKLISDSKFFNAISPWNKLFGVKKLSFQNVQKAIGTEFNLINAYHLIGYNSLKESEDDFSWVETSEPELVRDSRHRIDIIEDVIKKVKEYKGWRISKDSMDGVVYWNGQDNWYGMATPEWSEAFEVPVDIARNNDYDNVTVIKTPKFRYVIEVQDWYRNNYFELVYKVLTDYINEEEVPGIIETE